MKLDRIDRSLLRLLRTDARRTNSALAQEIGLSASACLRRVRLLEEHGVIRGYTALLGNEHDDSVTVIVQITLERQTEDYLARFEAMVRKHPEIRECFLMTGASDYFLRVTVPTAAAYERLHTETLSRLPGVMRVHSSFAIRDALNLQVRPPKG